MLAAAAPVIAPVSPLSYLLGLAAVAALVAAARYAGRLVLLARRALTFHRAGLARVAAADTAAARRRQRAARRTVVDVDDAGRVLAVTRTTRSR